MNSILVQFSYVHNYTRVRSNLALGRVAHHHSRRRLRSSTVVLVTSGCRRLLAPRLDESIVQGVPDSCPPKVPFPVGPTLVYLQTVSQKVQPFLHRAHGCSQETQTHRSRYVQQLQQQFASTYCVLAMRPKNATKNSFDYENNNVTTDTRLRPRRWPCIPYVRLLCLCKIRHPQNRKYITYRNSARRRSSHDRMSRAQKFGEVWPCSFRITTAN